MWEGGLLVSFCHFFFVLCVFVLISFEKENMRLDRKVGGSRNYMGSLDQNILYKN